MWGLRIVFFALPISALRLPHIKSPALLSCEDVKFPIWDAMSEILPSGRAQEAAALNKSLSELPIGLSVDLEGSILDSSQTELLEKMHCLARHVAWKEGRKKLRREGKRNGISWHHLHNFGGTFMCAEAAKQGEVVNGGANCNVAPDMCSTKDFAMQVDCKSRSASQFTFTAIERHLTDADVACNNMLYGVMLRDPLAGATSTFVANSFGDDVKNLIMQSLKGNRADVPAIKSHPCLPAWDTYQHVDNFATRSLSGQYTVAPGKVTRDMLEMAKSRLQKMHVILIMEEVGEHLPQLKATFDWDTSLIVPKQNAHDVIALKSVFTDDERFFLKEVNKFDYELYAFGKSLAANLTAKAISVGAK